MTIDTYPVQINSFRGGFWFRFFDYGFGVYNRRILISPYAQSSGRGKVWLVGKWVIKWYPYCRLHKRLS